MELGQECLTCRRLSRGITGRAAATARGRPKGAHGVMSARRAGLAPALLPQLVCPLVCPGAARLRRAPLKAARRLGALPSYRSFTRHCWGRLTHSVSLFVFLIVWSETNISSPKPPDNLIRVQQVAVVRNIPQAQASLVSDRSRSGWVEVEEIFAAGAKIFWFRQAVSCWAITCALEGGDIGERVLDKAKP